MFYFTHSCNFNLTLAKCFLLQIKIDFYLVVEDQLICIDK